MLRHILFLGMCPYSNQNRPDFVAKTLGFVLMEGFCNHISTILHGELFCSCTYMRPNFRATCFPLIAFPGVFYCNVAGGDIEMFYIHFLHLPTKIQVDSLSFVAIVHIMKNGVFNVNGTAGYFIDIMRKNTPLKTPGPPLDKVISFIKNGINGYLPHLRCIVGR